MMTPPPRPAPHARTHAPFVFQTTAATLVPPLLSLPTCPCCCCRCCCCRCCPADCAGQTERHCLLLCLRAETCSACFHCGVEQQRSSLRDQRSRVELLHRQACLDCTDTPPPPPLPPPPDPNHPTHTHTTPITHLSPLCREKERKPQPRHWRVLLGQF